MTELIERGIHCIDISKPGVHLSNKTRAMAIVLSIARTIKISSNGFPERLFLNDKYLRRTESITPYISTVSELPLLPIPTIQKFPS